VPLSQLSSIVLMCTIIALDNGLLSGVLITYSGVRRKWDAALLFATIVPFVQVVLIITVAPFLQNQFILLACCFILAWVSVQTMVAVLWSQQIDEKWTRYTEDKWWVLARIFLFTIIGNIDDVLWLGGKLHSQYAMLAFCTVATIPLYLFVTVYLADFFMRHSSVLLFGALTTAWAGSELFVLSRLNPVTTDAENVFMHQFSYIGVVAVIGALVLWLTLRERRFKR